MAEAERNELPNEAEALVIAAFHAARSRGKPDWRRMRIAVLKNRLLQMTGRAFNERKYGAETFREFLGRHRHLLRVEGADVELITKEVASDARQRIRPDLWRAAIDYSSGRRYAWDTKQQRARPAKDDDDPLIIPTVSPDEMNAWRREFAKSYPNDERVNHWCTQAMGTKGLPAHLQGVWTGFVRDRVVDRLSTWFAENGLEVDPLAPSRSTTSLSEPSTDKLRDLVLRCVSVMTLEELEALPLPAAAVLRALLEEP